MKILIVKLSSLGDVLHNLPIVWDLRSKYPGAQIDWIVEEAYVGLLEPLLSGEEFKGIDRIIPIGLRRWKSDLKKGEFIKSIQEYLEFKNNLRQVAYDLVIETQGLIKSAYVTRLSARSKKAKIFGLANQTEFSGYEPLARKFYTDRVMVPFRFHAVDRSRQVAAAAVGSQLPDRKLNSPLFYPKNFREKLRSTQLQQFITENDFGFDLTQPYVLCFHATAGEFKRWDNQSWIVIGQYLVEKGIQVIFPWGNPKEEEISQKLVDGIQSIGKGNGVAICPRSFSISQAFTIIAGAKLTIGVDTGLTHLSAVLNCPTIELYCDSPKWKTEGYWSTLIENLGDKGSPPNVEDVKSAIERLINV